MKKLKFTKTERYVSEIKKSLREYKFTIFFTHDGMYRIEIIESSLLGFEKPQSVTYEFDTIEKCKEVANAYAKNRGLVDG